MVGDAFKDALRVKVGDALDQRRKDIACSMFQAMPHSDNKPQVATHRMDNSIKTVQLQTPKRNRRYRMQKAELSQKLNLNSNAEPSNERGTKYVLKHKNEGNLIFNFEQ